MKKTLITRIIILCICFLTLFSNATFFAYATEVEKSSIEWSMDENAEHLVGNGKRYDRYYANNAFYGDARYSYYFKNKVSVNGEPCEVYGDSKDPHIVSVRYTDGYSYIFTDDVGRKALDNFLNGKEAIYYLEKYDDSKYTVIESDFLKTLDTAYNNYDNTSITLNVPVSTLKEGDIYELTAHDTLEMKAYQHGAIYYLPNGARYYICFTYLANNYFDADGYFSYRSGNVKALVLDDELLENINGEIAKMTTKPYERVYEARQPSNIDSVKEEDSSLLFWILYSFFAITLPLPVLILGLILPRSKRSKTPKMWYSLAISAGVWLIAAIALLILLIT